MGQEEQSLRRTKYVHVQHNSSPRSPSQLDKILNTEAFFSSPAVSIPPQDREVVVTLREERVKNGLELTHNVPAFLTTFCIILSVSGALKSKHTLL